MAYSPSDPPSRSSRDPRSVLERRPPLLPLSHQAGLNSPARGKKRMPDSVTEAAVTAALRNVEDPELHRDIVSLNMVRDLKIDDSRVSMTLMLTTPACPLTGPFKEAVEQALLAVPGVESADVALDAEVRGNQGKEAGPRPVEGVKNIIAVASNTGGVGKA